MVAVITPDNKRSLDQIKRDREIADALIKGGLDFSPVAHPLQGLARVAQAAAGAYRGYRADQADAANALASQQNIQAMLGGLGGGGVSGLDAGGFPAPPPPYSSTDPASDLVTQAHSTSLGGDIRAAADAIASIESAGSGDYAALGPLTKKGNRAYGRYQVMDFNIGPWTEAALGKRLTPQQFLSDPAAQDAVFQHRFGQYLQQYGPGGAASMWFTGRPHAPNAKDILGTSGSAYVDRFNRAYNRFLGQQPQTAGQAIDAIAPQQASVPASGGVPQAYSAIPAVGGRGEDQISQFMQWNPDPVGNEAANLAQIDPAMQQVIQRAREISGQNFVLGSGMRTPEQQKQAVGWGWSQTEDSDHLDGGAADLWPMNEQGQVVFDRPRQQQIVAAMKQAAQELGVDMEAGADWRGFQDMPHFGMIGQTPLNDAPVPTARPDAAPVVPNVPVAQNEADILSLEAQMAGQGDPAFAPPVDPMATAGTPEQQLAAALVQPSLMGQPQTLQPPAPVAAPPMPAPQPVADMPVAGQPPQGTPPMDPQMQIAQALTQLPVNPDMPMAGGPGAQAMPAPPSSGINPMVMQALSNPNASPQERQIAGILLQQQMAQQQAAQQAQAQQAAAAQAQAQRFQAANQAGINPNFASDDELWKQAAQDRFRAPPAAQQNYEFLVRQGVPPEQAMERAFSGGVNINMPGQPNIGSIPQGWQATQDEAGAWSMSPIPGGPAEQEARQAEEEAARRADVQTISDADKAETTLDAAGSVLEIMKKAETPATGTLSRPFALYSGTPAGKVRSYVKTLQSGVALGAMQRLKEASATGATGFGSLSAPELDLLISDIGALDPDNTEPEIFMKTIQRIQDRSRRVAEDISKNVSPERIQELGLQPFIDSFKGGKTEDAGAGTKRLKFNPATGELE